MVLMQDTANPEGQSILNNKLILKDHLLLGQNFSYTLQYFLLELSIVDLLNDLFSHRPLQKLLQFLKAGPFMDVLIHLLLIIFLH